ncbi:ABC transporter substrate-binding protein [Escherichia coli]
MEQRPAKERKLQRLYIGEPSAEAVAAQMPDLILISATGRRFGAGAVRSAFYHRPNINHQLRRQKLAVAVNAVGEITGHEKQAAERIAQFDKQLAAAKQQIKLPPQPVTAIVYTAAAHSANLWTPESAQGQMLERLGLYAGEVARRVKRQPKPGPNAMTSFSLVEKIWLQG